MSPNIALLGSGTFAQASYLPAILSLHPVKLNLHTIWSRSASSTESFLSSAQEKNADFKPKVLNGDQGLQAILDDKSIEAVLIVLPITAQPDIVRKALKAGKHVLSEKPLAKNVKDAQALIEEYEKEYKPKGLIWRVAENFAHEPVLREAGRLISSTQELGPILHWQLSMQGYIEDGSKYHKTGWRTIPDYQGGFLLDGGVHWTALLRTVLPESARPSSVISITNLHRTHLLPHDTIQAISLPFKKSVTESHGPKTKLTSSENKESDVPSEIGKSSPTGSILFSFASPDIPAEYQPTNSLKITFLNGIMEVKGVNSPRRGWAVKIVPSQGSSLKPVDTDGPYEGVDVEIKMFAEAITSLKNGNDVGEDYGTPRGAIWDLAVLQALLDSNGKEVSVDELLA
ncbi:uncharacterized protein IL334_005288 [Kwoniella shivajii]|uniref:Gfo/Idh/MocA-like oxidoreductase N-terminal domain-containing protein n=1 Tax=Kwoniella shivajii TaxID=564305 RepID=A0ABZ1D3Z3_9TREE|nr:hypothetical protein IL334_005288 [Kwoniella shivajii]